MNFASMMVITVKLFLSLVFWLVTVSVAGMLILERVSNRAEREAGSRRVLRKGEDCRFVTGATEYVRSSPRRL